MSSPLSYHSLDINTTTTTNSSHDINSKQQNDKTGIGNSLINTVTIEPIPSRSASLNDLKADLT